jgi:hypothetical protein
VRNDRAARPARAEPGPYEECPCLKKIRIIDLLEGKVAIFLAILLFVILVLGFAVVMSQTT